MLAYTVKVWELQHWCFKSSVPDKEGAAPGYNIGKYIYMSNNMKQIWISKKEKVIVLGQ